MPSPELFLILAALCPLLGFMVLLPFGRRLETPVAGWAAATLMVLSFVLTLLAMVKWYDGKKGLVTWGMSERPILRTYAWIPAPPAPHQRHPGFVDAGVYIDSLTVAMFAMVTLVAAIVHIFAIGYMRHQPHFGTFAAWLGFLCFAMLAMVLSASLLQIFFFWQMLSIATVQLTAHHADRLTSRAARRGFLVLRIGDGLLLLGAVILLCKTGTMTLPELWATLANDAGAEGGSMLLAASGILLFCGAAAKCAVFPMQVWLADAMEAPAPAATVICSAGTLAAGVYFVGRIFPLLTPDARLFIAILGVVTLTMAGLVTLAQTDILRLLAWASVSQLGYTLLAFGVGSWGGALFHLITQSFFLALLFLAAASVIGAMRGQRRLSIYGGLARKLPVTLGAFAVGVLAIACAPWLSGYYSQGMILGDAAALVTFAGHVGGRSPAYWALFVLPMAMIYITAFSLTRCAMLTFGGSPRKVRFFARAREHPARWGPLLALACLSVMAGYAMNIPELLQASVVETNAFCNDLLARGNEEKAKENEKLKPAKFVGFDQAWPILTPPPPDPAVDSAEAPILALSLATDAHEQGRMRQHAWLRWGWFVGGGLAVAIYWNGYSITRRLRKITPIRWFGIWLSNAMFFDELYDWTVVNLALGLGTTCQAIDGYIVHPTVDAIIHVGRRALRLVQKEKTKPDL